MSTKKKIIGLHFTTLRHSTTENHSTSSWLWSEITFQCYLGDCKKLNVIVCRIIVFCLIECLNSHHWNTYFERFVFQIKFWMEFSICTNTRFRFTCSFLYSSYYTSFWECTHAHFTHTRTSHWIFVAWGLVPTNGSTHWQDNTNSAHTCMYMYVCSVGIVY